MVGYWGFNASVSPPLGFVAVVGWLVGWISDKVKLDRSGPQFGSAHKIKPQIELLIRAKRYERNQLSNSKLGPRGIKGTNS